MVTLVATNAFYKLNKFYATETETLVLGGEWNSVGSHRGGAYTTYELFLQYIDDNDEIYMTKKAITGDTYRHYSQGDTITLLYRNNNVYDTFVEAKSMKEVWEAFINFFTFILGLYVVSVFYLIRKWRKKHESEHNSQQIESSH